MRCPRSLLTYTALASLVCSMASGLAAPQKSPVPDAETQQAVKRAAAELFSERFRKAETDADKIALAKEIIQAAMKVRDGSVDQYVLLSIAADVAAGAGDAPTAL